MAVTVRQKSEVVGNDTNATPTEPAGAVQGDVLWSLALCNSGSAILTIPAGWTSVYSGTVGGARWDFAWILRGASAPDLTWQVQAGNWREVFVVCVKTDTANPIRIDAVSANGSSGTGTDPNPPAVTVAATSALILTVGLNWAGALAGGYTASAGYTIQTANLAGSGGLVQSKVVSAAGSQDPAAFTNTGSSDIWNGATVALTDELTGATPRAPSYRDFPKMLLRRR